jgi:hypothetical protein
MKELLRRVFATDSGMLAIWQPEHFKCITDFESWERELLQDDDIIRHIEVGAFVPLNIHADGAYECVLRAGTATEQPTLTARESRYLICSSAPYLFCSRGSLAISGLEYIGSSPDASIASASVPQGNWSVTVHHVDWAREPGCKTPDGKPSSTALPNFIVLLTPAVATLHFRTEVDTFD